MDKKGAKLNLSDAGTERGKIEFRMTAPGRLSGTMVSTEMLANVLSNQVERSVQDFTGLKGIFDFTLAWSPDIEPQSAGNQWLSSIFTAIQEQLGLSLEPRKCPVDVLVVDHIEKEPTGS